MSSRRRRISQSMPRRACDACSPRPKCFFKPQMRTAWVRAPPLALEPGSDTGKTSCSIPRDHRKTTLQEQTPKPPSGSKTHASPISGKRSPAPGGCTAERSRGSPARRSAGSRRPWIGSSTPPRVIAPARCPANSSPKRAARPTPIPYPSDPTISRLQLDHPDDVRVGHPHRLRARRIV